MRWLALLFMACFAVQGQTQDKTQATTIDANSNASVNTTLRFTIGFAEHDPRFKYVNTIMSRALAEHGFKFKLVPAPAGREIFFAIDRHTDGISATIPKAYWPLQNDSLISLQDPFITVRNVVITKTDLPSLNTWDDVINSDLKIVYVRHHYSARTQLQDNTNTLEASTLTQAIRLFISGRADILLAFEAADEVSALPALNTANFQPAVTLSERELYTFISKNYSAYAQKFNESIQRQRRLLPIQPKKQAPGSVFPLAP